MADLRNANLDRANLNGANLEKADLRDTSLDHTSFKSTRLIKANLTGVDLSKTILLDVHSNLSDGADLNGAILPTAAPVDQVDSPNTADEFVQQDYRQKRDFEGGGQTGTTNLGGMPPQGKEGQSGTGGLGGMPRNQSADRSDSTPTHTDSPATLDLLGRRALAQALAERLKYIKKETGESLLVNIHGPWGAGKTSLLRFVRDALTRSERAEDRWIVVDFNAWQHRAESPPWWAMMNAVFRESINQVSRTKKIEIWLKEHWWRLSQGHAHRLLALALMIWVVFYFGVRSTGLPLGLSSWTDFLKAVVLALGIVSTVWGGVLVVTGTLLPSTSRRADMFHKVTVNPVRQLANHLADLTRLVDRPVAVFIDDLDRCRGSYVVSLLESVQTLFREAGVVFVVAADRRWLTQSFDDAYKSHKDVIAEPGKPLGYLFLEKVFQISVGVPQIGEQVRDDFWKDLLRGSEWDSERFEAMVTAASVKSSGKTTSEMNSMINQAIDPLERRALQHAVIVHQATPELMAETEHDLEPFAHFLESNPRSMKRFVNAYGMQRAIAYLNDVEIETTILARWTILSLRWPLLAEYLRKKPNAIRAFQAKKPQSDSVPVNLAELVGDPALTRVVRGDGTAPELDEDALLACLQLS